MLANELLTGGDIPKAEFGFEASVALTRHAPGDQCLRVDGFPTLKLRRGVNVDDPFDKGGLIDRSE